MPSIEELRAVWTRADYITDDLLQSPWFHIGVLKTGLADGDRLKMSVAVVSEALSAAENSARS